MNRFLPSLDRFFFAPAPAQGLGCCRIAFYGWLFLFYLPAVETYGAQNVAAFADVGEIFWDPVFPFARLRVTVLPHPWIDALVIGWRIALLLACAGWFTRLSMVFALLAGAYLIGLPLNFGTMSHTGGIVVLGLAIMALSRAGESLSIDALIRRRRGLPLPQPSGEYRWPIRFIWVLLAVAYFVSGASKLLSNGLGYLNPDVMAGFLRHRSFAWQVRPLTGWGLRLADIWWICTAASLWTLIAEMCFWLVLVSRRARAILASGMFMTHIGIAMLLGPQFFQWMALFVFFVPWGDLVVRRKPRGTATSPPATRSPAAGVCV